MFIHKLTEGNLRLWLDGNLPENLRRMWRQKYGRGNDPLLSSILCHIGIALAIVGLSLGLALAMAATAGGEQVGIRVQLALFVSVAFTVIGCGCGLWLARFPTNQDFYPQLMATQRYLNLSLQDLGGLSREGLRHHASKCLEDSGQRLRAAELRLPSYHPEREKLRKGFEERYATFLALGMIEDVGYGQFIPQ